MPVNEIQPKIKQKRPAPLKGRFNTNSNRAAKERESEKWKKNFKIEAHTD